LKVVEGVERLLDRVGGLEARDVLQPAVEFEPLHIGQPAHPLEQEVAGPHQLAPAADRLLPANGLADHVEPVIGHANDVELVHHDGDLLAKYRLSGLLVGRPHVDADDLDAIPAVQRCDSQ
jgi:hypothetical protein